MSHCIVDLNAARAATRAGHSGVGALLPVPYKFALGSVAEMVWHYAPWMRLASIVESGALRCSNAGAPNEQPMLWFSAHQEWEPTATKMVNTKSGLLPLTFHQQAEQFGCIRFGLPASDMRLKNWKEACVAAGTPRAAVRALELAGEKRGASPAHWFGSAVSIAPEDLRFQVWTGEWLDAVAVQMAHAWTKSRAPNAGEVPKI